jgi:TIR domain-containing protein
VGDYNYDAFISYRRGATFVGAWVSQFFVESFTAFFTEELGGEAKIFWDKDSVEVGATWPRRLNEAVCGSKCLVAVLTPTYFKSDWCRWEWGSFAERTRRVGKHCEIIAPIGLHDGEWFPADVKAFQEQDFRKFFMTGGAFRESPLFLDFQVQVKNLATRVAEMVREAPPAPPEGWPTVEAPTLEPPPIPQPRLRAA